MMEHEKVLVLDFGGQYNQLIARRVRDINVYCEVWSYKTPLEKIRAGGFKGIIFTGGPNSVYLKGSPVCDPEILELGIPVLGICYGAQLIAFLKAGVIAKADRREYGKTLTRIGGDGGNPHVGGIFDGIPGDEIVTWMSHTDYVEVVPEGFRITAVTDTCPSAAFEDNVKRLYAVQFHPEVSHTDFGTQMLRNFVYGICGCKGDWVMSSFVRESVEALREKIGGRKVLCALSGGVDSSVCAAMIHRAVGKQLTCIFVDHGLLRKDEGDQVEKIFADDFDLDIIRVNSSERFLARLAGVCDPEVKRKIIGEEFIRVFEEEARKIGKVDFLVQGTIYPDVIESGLGDSAVIKSHHNVGGLPDHVDFEEIIEPLRNLFKDEVRRAGIELGMPEDLVWRQPFPGPGLGIRIMGDVTSEKLYLLREADAIFRDEIAAAGLHKTYNQYFAVLTGVRSVGVMGDERTYDYTVALRSVTTTDFMTADFARIPYDLLEKISSRIVNEVRNVNRVVYDITTKPPATIEWE